MTIKEWNQFRRLLGKPRRFSKKFVHDEIGSLNKFRERVRIWLTKKQLINDGFFSPELTKAI